MAQRIRALSGRRSWLLLIAACAAAAVAFVLAWSLALSGLQARLDQQLVLTGRAVETEISRFRSLPDVAGEDARIAAALTDPSAHEAASRYLKRVVDHSGASELYLLDATGVTIAASNWATLGSFVGQDYGFRPYFRDAMATGRGQFYAIGVTTGLPGYFLATRISAGRVDGVMVVKVDLRPLQDTWREAGLAMALADADGVVFLSGRPDWSYRALRPLSADTLARLAQQRTYDGIDLTRTAPLLASGELAASAFAFGPLHPRLIVLDQSGWHLLAAAPTAPALASATGWAMGAALVALVLMASAMVLHQRRQLTTLRLRQNEVLEARVTERTAALAREIDARRQAEIDLRAAQQGLIHSEKMAALGRMSTAIVHEISQPLAAMEATLAAAELTLPKTDTTTAPRLDTVRGLIRRMQRTTKHLKSFGRKEPGDRVLVDLTPVIISALELVTPRARAVGVTPIFVPPPLPLTIMAGPVRMEQVLVNLLLNALDAVENRPNPQITLRATQMSRMACLTVTDNGSGIASEDLSRVTEPFFTTKSTGESLGLGLSISRTILGEFGGELALAAAPGGGTEVRVSLPLVARANLPAQQAAE
ncbi:MAG: ATP-binding protein [Cypionkella sp.]|uniref:sensor histidine kinase n=1 Tax=Cypionkella sp. TaxID=2811411 RepID=UPI002ABA9BBC|nr:ATP-binding protein [Cypionkella sp.]MDZ4309503.1 ATP-binding protein [Cypionkella sp.]